MTGDSKLTISLESPVFEFLRVYERATLTKCYQMILHIRPAPYKPTSKAGHEIRTHRSGFARGAFAAHNQNGKEAKHLNRGPQRLLPTVAADVDAAVVDAAAALLRRSRRTPNLAAPGEDPEKTCAR